jgi:uncharacterized protein involved in outer membrane biogenesis
MSSNLEAPSKRQDSIAAQTIAFVLFLLVALILTWRWDWLIPIVEARASAAIGRQVTIQHLQVRLGSITEIAAEGVTIADPAGFAATTPLGTVSRVLVGADIMPYIWHGVVGLPFIEVDQPNAALRQLPNGDTNYALHIANNGGSTSQPVQIGNLVIVNGSATVDIPKLKTNFTMTIATENSSTNSDKNEIIVTAHGTYSGQPITGQFIGGSLLSLRDPSNPYPINLHIQNGTTVASLVGTTSNPLNFSGANLKLSFSGQSMANLYQLTGIPIPATPPYTVTGRLNYSKNAFQFEDFAGRVGSSDLEGNISETAPVDGSRRQITADLTSRRVDLTDLAGFLGAEPGTVHTPGEDAATRAAELRASANPKLLPDTPINLPKINAANIKLTYKGAKIINKDVPMDNVLVNLSIENGRITLHPLDFAVGSGTIASNIDLNPVGGVLHTQADVDFRKIPLARVMAATHSFAGDGVVGGTAHLTATGNSMAQMLGHGDGHMNLFMNQGGDISALMVDLAGLQMGDAVLSALGIPNKTQIKCLVSGFTLTDGQLKTDELLIATPEANILGSGSANLTNETLNMELRTQATHFSIGSLSSPINISGTLKHPSMLPAVGPLALRAGSAVGLGLLFPPLALLPTIRLGLGDKNACADAVLALDHKPAPATK